jgi:hypothetical protein
MEGATIACWTGDSRAKALARAGDSAVAGASTDMGATAPRLPCPDMAPRIPGVPLPRIAACTGLITITAGASTVSSSSSSTSSLSSTSLALLLPTRAAAAAAAPPAPRRAPLLPSAPAVPALDWTRPKPAVGGADAWPPLPTMRGARCAAGTECGAAPGPALRETPIGVVAGRSVSDSEVSESELTASLPPPRSVGARHAASVVCKTRTGRLGSAAL